MLPHFGTQPSEHQYWKYNQHQNLCWMPCSKPIYQWYVLSAFAEIFKSLWVVKKKLNPESFKEKKIIETDAYTIVENNIEKVEKQLNAEIEESLEFCDWRG